MSLLLTPLSLFINILAVTTFIIEQLVFVIVALAVDMGFEVAISNLSCDNDINNIIVQRILKTHFNYYWLKFLIYKIRQIIQI